MTQCFLVCLQRARHIQRRSKIIKIISCKGFRGGPPGVYILSIGAPTKAWGSVSYVWGGMATDKEHGLQKEIGKDRARSLLAPSHSRRSSLQRWRYIQGPRMTLLIHSFLDRYIYICIHVYIDTFTYICSYIHFSIISPLEHPWTPLGLPRPPLGTPWDLPGTPWDHVLDDGLDDVLVFQ